jgi:hypothetical protein
MSDGSRLGLVGLLKFSFAGKAQAKLTLCSISIDINSLTIELEFTDADLSLHTSQLRLIHGSGCG